MGSPILDLMPAQKGQDESLLLRKVIGEVAKIISENTLDLGSDGTAELVVTHLTKKYGLQPRPIKKMKVVRHLEISDVDGAGNIAGAFQYGEDLFRYKGVVIG